MQLTKIKIKIALGFNEITNSAQSEFQWKKHNKNQIRLT